MKPLSFLLIQEITKNIQLTQPLEITYKIPLNDCAFKQFKEDITAHGIEPIEDDKDKITIKCENILFTFLLK